MVLPFGLGAALSYPVYNQFIPEDVAFTHFMLFAGVAFSITAFPVLCRILTELKLLDTTVGIVVLSAGVANDIGEKIHVCCLEGILISDSGMDASGPFSSIGQRGIRSYGSLGFDDLCGVDSFHAARC